MNISPMRMSGLASGMDTDSIIKNLMDTQRLSVNKLYAKKQITEWQRSAYREMNTKITTFRNDKLFNFKLEGNLQSRTAVVSGESNAVSAKATGDAQLGSLTVKVTALAEAASNKSAGPMPMGATFDLNMPLGAQSDPPVYDTSVFKINGFTIEVDPSVDSFNDVIKRINKVTNVTAFYEYNDTNGGQISFVSKQTGKVNGLNGNDANISFEDVTGNFLGGFLQITEPGISAKNAVANINGLNVERTSNTFKVNGIEMTLQQLSGSDAVSKIEVKMDVDKLVDSIKSFIADYNALLKELTDKTQEKKYRDFPPLMTEQKEGMKEKEIELWESKAKSGMLRSDQLLLGAIGSMRQAMQGIVETGNSKYRTLSAIGITTGPYYENGKLELSDETKLRDALAEDPEAVIALFTANGTNQPDRADMGIAERLYGDLNTSLNKMKEKAGLDLGLKDNSFLTKQLDQYDKDILRWTDRLTNIEARFYRQFTAMERAISMYNSQSTYLSNAFSAQ